MFLFLLCCQLLSFEGNPSNELIAVLDNYGIQHASWEEIVTETQTKWIRKQNTELSEIGNKNDLDPEKSYTLFSQLQMTEALCPTLQTYDTVTVFGATLETMRKRFLFVKSLCDNGLRYNTLVILTGDRLRDEVLEKEAAPLRNETEIAKWLYQQMDLPKECEVYFVDTPCRQGQKTPTTKDTLQFWLQSNPQPGRLLMISNQPFIQRQGCVALKTLPFPFECCGPGFTLEEYKKNPKGLAILQDQLARWIYCFKTNSGA